MSKSEGTGESGEFPERARKGLSLAPQRQLYPWDTDAGFTWSSQDRASHSLSETWRSCHLVTLELTITVPFHDSSISQDELARKIASLTGHLPEMQHIENLDLEKNRVRFQRAKGAALIVHPHVPLQIAVAFF